MTDVKQAIEYLQGVFPNKTLYYSKEISVLVGRSEKATQQLICRNGLSFKIQKVGGKWCTDILSVANWLAASDQIKPEKPPLPEPTVKKLRKTKMIGFSGQLMEMRQERASKLARMCADLFDEEQEFLAEIAMHLVFNDTRAKYKVVFCEQTDGRQQQSTFMFIDEQAAMARVNNLVVGQVGEVAKISAYCGKKAIYKAIKCGTNWLVQKTP